MPLQGHHAVCEPAGEGRSRNAGESGESEQRLEQSVYWSAALGPQPEEEADTLPGGKKTL